MAESAKKLPRNVEQLKQYGPPVPKDKYSFQFSVKGKPRLKQNFMFTKTHPLQSYHIDCIASQKNQKEVLLSCSAQLHVISVRVTVERENRSIVQIYHTYSSAESSIINVRFRLFGFFSMVSS